MQFNIKVDPVLVFECGCVNIALGTAPIFILYLDLDTLLRLTFIFLVNLSKYIGLTSNSYLVSLVHFADVILSRFE